ncbi:MAG TPA: quinolinate synthase NadA [Candidatus Nitrosocosmicus sp.]
MSVVNIDFTKEIQKLKKEKNAIILAHNYQIPEVQDIADFIGDSLKLSNMASKTDASIIVFCGVHFMAETASIISPDKKVLIPDLDAGCSLASSINSDELLEWKKQNPEAVVVSYVNTSAEIKALSDYCCTSANAVKIVENIPAEKTILFLPDMFLGAYVAETTKRKNIKIWPGECHVHAGIRSEDINLMLKKYRNAEFLIHPECSCTSSTLYHISKGDINKESKILSTEGMMREARSSTNNQFIVATETGMLYRMKMENPQKDFIPIKKDAVCKYMKKITLEKVYNSLLTETFEIKVPSTIAAKAKIPIYRMLSVTA